MTVSFLDTSFVNPDAQTRARELRAALTRGEPVSGEITNELRAYEFYHVIEVIPGIRTKGIESALIYQNAFYEAARTISFEAKRVLDVGCRDGAMLLFAEKAGARELVGIDNDPSLGMTNFLIPFLGSKIKSYGCNLYDLLPDELGKFDIVISCGLLYHLGYPMLGVKRLSNLLTEGGTLILETALIDYFDDFPILFYPFHGQSPFEATSPSFFNLACLENAFQQAALSKPRVLKRFNSLSFDPKVAFPQFASRRSELITITRTIVAAQKDPLADFRQPLHRYFEGRHQFHTTGRF
jgi:SAM-dependent methyltransferase